MEKIGALLHSGMGLGRELGIDSILSSQRMNERKPEKVCELMTQQRTWNASLVWKWFDKDSAKNILATDINGKEDTWQWKYNNRGVYNIKSGYKFLLRQEPNQARNPTLDWKLFWKDPMFPKWKIFLWKVLNSALPLRKTLRKRGMDVPVNCVLCGKGEESDNHVFRTEISQRIRKAGMLGTSVEASNNIPFRERSQNFLRMFEKQGTVFAATLWAIWIERNNCIFKEMM
ncbi:hypothetical protein RDABS01_037639 [Bienertia sinuspersici]